MLFLFFDMIILSSIEEKCLNEINEYRIRNGRKALRMNDKLNSAARIQSEHQMRTMKCTHTGPENNEDLYDRIINCGYKTSSMAENVAQSNGLDHLRVFNMWRKSKGHNSNMLSSEYEETGIACVMDKDLVTYWTQVFAKTSDPIVKINTKAHRNIPIKEIEEMFHMKKNDLMQESVYHKPSCSKVRESSEESCMACGESVIDIIEKIIKNKMLINEDEGKAGKANIEENVDNVINDLSEEIKEIVTEIEKCSVATDN